MTKKLLMGNEAMAHAALEVGVGVVAGYPGTPSSEIVATIARQHERGAAHGVHVEWSTNEKAALELLFGASLAGSRCLFTCKQMGMNVASDALLCLNYVSVRGGLVLVVADDPGPISSQTEQDTRRFAMFAKVPVLDPATPEQAYDMIKAAFDLSERFSTPVIVRPTTRVDHASAFFDVQEETHALKPLGDGFQHDPSKYVIFPGRAYQAHAEINQRLNEIAEVFALEQPFSAFNPITQANGSVATQSARSNRPTYPAPPQPLQAELAQPSLGILVGGITTSYVREALRMIMERALKANISIPAYRLMQVGTPYPFPEQAIEVFSAGLSSILVLEELDGVLEDELAQYAGRAHANFEILGRYTNDANDHGENSVDDVMARIERFLGLTGRLSLSRFKGALGEDAGLVHLTARGQSELPARPPVLCAGCPHRGSFYATTQALEVEGLDGVLCGDIGCYTLGNAQPLDALDTCLCMGAGVTMAQGISVADPSKKAIAYIGDSTFFASGETGLSNAAYNDHDITVMVLDNSTTAMTGFQPHPGTGITLMGPRSKPLSIEEVLRANGFNYIEHSNPFDRDQSVEKVRNALTYKGPSAVIFEGVCAQLTKPKTPVIINREICTGCKRCINAIGCPAIGFNRTVTGPRSRDRGQATIDNDLCNGCGLCTQVCPFHAIHVDSAVYRASASNLAAEAGGWPAVNPEQQARINEFKEHRAKHALTAEDAIAAAVEVAAAVEAAAGDEQEIDAAQVEEIEAAVEEILQADAAASCDGAEDVQNSEDFAHGAQGRLAQPSETFTPSASTTESRVQPEGSVELEDSDRPVPALAGEDERIGVEEVIEGEVEAVEEKAEPRSESENEDEVEAQAEDMAEDESKPEAEAEDVQDLTLPSQDVPDLEYIPEDEPKKPVGERPVPMPEAEDVATGEPPVSREVEVDAAAVPEAEAVDATVSSPDADRDTDSSHEGLENYKAGIARKKAPMHKASHGKHAAPETIAISFDFDEDEDEDEEEGSAAGTIGAPVGASKLADHIEGTFARVDTVANAHLEEDDSADAAYEADSFEDDDREDDAYIEADFIDIESTTWHRSAGYDAWGSYNINNNDAVDSDDLDDDIQEDDPRA